ncbi:MAG: hypothetical protein DRP65_10725, partial [Planctomycetota bacterium]
MVLRVTVFVQMASRIITLPIAKAGGNTRGRLLIFCCLAVLALSSNTFADIPYGYKVQSGRVEVSGIPTDVPITAVSDMSRAFVLVSSGTGYAATNTNADIVQVRGYLQAVDNIRFERTTTSNSSWVSYEVIECLNNEFTAYRGQSSMTMAEASKTLSIGATVTPANCLAFVTADNDVASRAQYNQAMLTARVSSTTEVTVERNGSGTTAPNFNWVVVEFDPAKINSIQSGSVTADKVTYAAPQTVTISSVNLANSILIFQARPSANGMARTAWAGNFNSSTQIKFYQHTASSDTGIEWYVIDFGDGAAQRGLRDESANPAWLASDATLSPSVDTTKTMHFHSMTCAGTGTAYPRAMSTAEFTSGTNLRIQRMRDGQASYIEWQVLELPSGMLDTAPSPDPMTWAVVPFATGPSSISMTATTASDPAGVEYYFTCTAGGGNDSGWQDSATYEDTGLAELTQYTYTVKARDKGPSQNETAPSSEQSATTEDGTPPAPDPATFSSAPAALSDTEITMTATTGTDASGPVEYYFDEISGNPGGTDSGWVTNPVYNDTGLSPSTLYTYTVQMRDALLNTGGLSTPPQSATTDPAPDTDPPTPDPMTWATVPYATGTTSIEMTATTASDASGVEYYFTCTAGGGNDSGWQDSPTYEDTGLNDLTEYTYTARARDKSSSQNE